ncbi:cytosolic phospholipase A2 gamma isoform X2 [Varanus komodoensis]|uniref:cytosolic phospholipase A2 gamma isoform X2 n=1 Tax=Varanus komodoensis TaxID=61221 RepID=UPI001CF778AB|nr:cytosolic phospholipase A2 gamma isoform X2 [Varanus komodoensis]
MENNVAEKGRVRVRISNDLSEGEKRATATRKEEVKKGLDKLGIPCDVDNIPNIAVLASGGALRAMVALCGTLVELRKYNLLDCIMYLGGVSGSTWCMSGLYKNKDWVEKIEELEKCLHETLTQGKWETKKAIESVLEAAEDECYSLTDIWSYFIVHRLLNQFDETTLSVHGASCENGKNPYPIYAAVEAETYQKPHAGTWLEFTPHEAGFPGIGAYVDIKYFGSVFHNGQMIEERKEKNACYLQDVLENILEETTSNDLDHDSSKSSELLREMLETWNSADEETRQEEYMRLNQALDTDIGRSDSPALHNFSNMIKKTCLCLLNWTWGSTKNFLYHCSDVEFPELSSKPVLYFIDAGLTINTAYPSILRPERQVKLILSFDFSAGDPFLTVRRAAEYCDAHGIPFPKIDEAELQDTDNPLDSYIFRGERAPTVMHFPLFNKVNCPGKIAEYREQFSTFKMHYLGEEIEKLLTAAKKNVSNVQQKILQEMKRIAGPPSQKA